MRPIVFEGKFGWLHPANGSDGVVLCSPFGYDALCTHRGMRRLAERLAARGMPVLRFDYPGTGDSAGNTSDAGLWRAWIDSVKQAVALLRESTGVERVSLIGLRLGGMLAALAAQELGDVHGLALLAPVFSGKHYQRELRAHYRQWLSLPTAIDCTAEPDTDEFVEAYGFRIYRDTLDSLRAVDLHRDASRPAARVLLLDALDPARVDALAAHYTEQGVAVERQPFDEYSRFMMESLDSELPQAAFQSIENWLVAGGAQRVEARAAACPPAWAANADAFAGHDVAPGLHETPVWLNDGKVFGVYCLPDGAAAATAPAVLLLNTGAVSRIGNARLSVNFARRLARQGIASLRIDVGGLGDSMPSLDAPSLDGLYAQSSADDAACASRWLTGRGHAGAVLVGICAGAYTGLYAATREPAVLGAVLINLPKFRWQNICDEHGKPKIAVAAFGSTRNYLRSMMQPRKWLRVIKGQTGGFGVVRVLSARMAARLRETFADRLQRLCGIELGASEERRLFAELDEQGVDTHLVYGVFDEGVEELERCFGVRGARLRRFKRVHVAFCKHTDHAVLSSAAQENIMSYVENVYRDGFTKLRRPDIAARDGEPHSRDSGRRRARATQWLAKRARAFRLFGHA
ncbi:serine aminopeptidase domain-containing protein [Paraburkholderia susongensis]|uniref:Lysophospholipase, alpha-beta hydrolase superfamily n=1 Tax=Paraburkholderia susongensis TaxID=1515439 RepID=A0A1X7JDI5_9BURK|nr:alpha/beta fold hydrolase [Paraburkholderia susongensis]SMG26043.1 Lysophospholipase, alpha-beta hydrolase superfamily [Paraburkholderia susongensis]